VGRQIAIVASPVDEQSLVDFLREAGPIQLCLQGAGTKAELFPKAIPPLDPPRSQLFIWNQQYRWTPKLLHPTPKGGGLIENIYEGPVIELGRVLLDNFSVERGCCLGRGRIYWAHRNRQKGFLAWYERLIRWIRKNGTNLSKRGRACYCLPDALRIWEARDSAPRSGDGM
jgi:hypothetical protein